VIPCYNEVTTILELITRVQALPIDKSILVIDNCSTDGTRAVLTDAFPEQLPDSDRARLARVTPFVRDQRIYQAGEVTVLLQPRNYEKGQSFRIGIALAEAPYIVCQDADLEYDPSDILRLLEHAERTQAAAVFGSRLSGHVTIARDVFQIGRVGLTKFFKLLYGSSITDVATCYKLMRTDVARSLLLLSSGFNLDFEIPAELRRHGHAIHEVPVQYFPRSAREGKKIRFRDGIAAAWTMLKCRVRRAERLNPQKAAALPDRMADGRSIR